MNNISLVNTLDIEDAGNSEKYNWFFPALNTAGTKYDIIGAPYYPFWTNKTAEQIPSRASTMVQTIIK